MKDSKYNSNLKRQLVANGYTQYSFALAIGVDNSTVVRWVKNGGRPRPTRIAVIAKALSITPLEATQLFDY